MCWTQYVFITDGWCWPAESCCVVRIATDFFPWVWAGKMDADDAIFYLQWPFTVFKAFFITVTPRGKWGKEILYL